MIGGDPRKGDTYFAYSYDDASKHRPDTSAVSTKFVDPRINPLEWGTKDFDGIADKVGFPKNFWEVEVSKEMREAFREAVIKAGYDGINFKGMPEKGIVGEGVIFKHKIPYFFFEKGTYKGESIGRTLNYNENQVVACFSRGGKI